MDINIIASNCTEINNEHIFSLLKSRDKTKNHIIIAPDRCQFSIEQRLFEETGEKCFFDVSVISLSRLSKQVIGSSDKNILSKQSGVALVKKILKDNKDKLSVFGKAMDYIGFAETLFKTICFYKSCYIPCNEVFVSDSLSYANLKQKDIKLVYTEYEKYLQNDFTDSFNQLKVFADMIDVNTFENTIFYFVEFDDFTRLMYEIIIKLARFSSGIYLTCLYGKESNNSNIYNNKVYYDLIDLFKAEGLDYSINKLIGFSNTVKQKMATNLLSYSPENLDIAQLNIDIKSFDNIKDEVKFVLADIYSRLISNREDLSKYAIVVPSLLSYKDIMVQELSKYNMPYYLDESKSFVESPIIRLLLDITNLILGDYRLYDFAVVLKSPILNFDSVAVCKYDNYLRRIGAIADACLKEEKTDNDDIKELILLVKEWREKTKKSTTYSAFIEIMHSIFEYIQLRSGLYVSSLDAIGNRVYMQVCNKFDNINKDIIKVFGDVEVSLEEFISVYRAYFESSTISMPPITSDTLFIADFETSFLNKFDYLYILGNNEAILPSQKLDNGLISDEELARLPNANKLTPTVAMLNARKVLKLYDMVFKYNKQLNLSFVNSNSEGKLYPNNLIECFIKMSNIEVNNYSAVLDVLNNNYEQINEENVIFNNLTNKIAQENLLGYLSNWQTYNSGIPYRTVCSTIYNIIPDTDKALIDTMGIPRVIDNLKTDNLFMKTGRTSISQIETFNRCPYVHFVRYGLKLSDNQNTKLKPNNIGSIIHEVLSCIVPIILEDDKDNDRIKEIAQSILDTVLTKEEFKEMVENSVNTYVIKALRRELDRIIDAVIREIKLSNFVPQFYEYKFDKSLVVNGINIKGYIDRIDTKDDGFIIIDYKTGDNQFSNYNDVYSGKKLQLLVYAKAFENISGKKARGVFYLPISNGFGNDKSYRFNGVMLKTDANIVNMDTGLIEPGYTSPVVNLGLTTKGKFKSSDYYNNMCISQEDFDYLLDFAIKQVSLSIDKILNGEILPYPICDNGKTVCEYCDYKALCNYEGNNDHNIDNIETIEKLKEMSV